MATTATNLSDLQTVNSALAKAHVAEKQAQAAIEPLMSTLTDARARRQNAEADLRACVQALSASEVAKLP